MSTAAVVAFPGVVAESAVMRDLLVLAARLAGARSSVLLEGESGTGKDLLAYWLHYGGSRRHAPFIKIHCPSIPEELLESELFGFEKGAFTDAKEAKVGKLELAASGTVYFDQVQDLALSLQAKLLRVVEECRFERLGGTHTLSVDVRFVCSTNTDLREAVALGRFREDFYHRLAVVPLRLPSLRERREDIVPLARQFLERDRERGATRATSFTPDTLDALRGYEWPGNVRELRAIVERAALLTTTEEVAPSALPQHVLENPSTLWAGRERWPSLKDVERAYIRYVIERVGGNQTRAAAILGVSRKALWEKRRRFGLA